MNIDDLAVELTKSMEAESLNKAIPPRLYYRLRRFFLMTHKPQTRGMPSGLGQRSQTGSSMLQAISGAVAQKAEELLALSELKKNELMASVYDSGSVKLDFGSGVPEPVKKAAMAWAKRKGLKPIEATLNKSVNSSSSVMFTSGLDLDGACVKRVKWEIGE